MTHPMPHRRPPADPDLRLEHALPAGLRTRATRRQLLGAVALGAAGMGLAACGVDARGRSGPSSVQSGPGTVDITVTRPSAGHFEPWLMTAPGTTTSVTWLDGTGRVLSTSTTPSIPLPAGEHVLRLVAAQPEAIHMVNLGYGHDQDAGELADAAYDWPKQYVTGISGLNRLTGLRMFMCSDTEDSREHVLTGHLDLSGLAHLLQVECYLAQVSSIDLTGCSSLVRLDLEQNALSTLDINPVRSTLKDLRSAAQTTGALEFAPMDQPFPALWHYCIRDQDVTNILTLDKIPNLREYWIWNTNQTEIGTPVATSIESILAADNRLTQSAVDALLIGLDRGIPGNGAPRTVEVDGGASAGPSAEGLTAKAALESKGWSITVNA